MKRYPIISKVSFYMYIKNNSSLASATSLPEY